MSTSPHPETERTPSAPGTVVIRGSLADELRRAISEIEHGDYIELTPQELDRWADAGVVPWLDESQD